MKANAPVVSLAEAAYYLRIQLGPIRNWTNFLTDNIRGLQSITGLTLMPCARKQDGKMFRPVYAVADIKAFVEKVLAAVPSAGKTPVKAMVLAIDTAKNWRNNKFDSKGSPVAMLNGNSGGQIFSYAH